MIIKEVGKKKKDTLNWKRFNEVLKKNELLKKNKKKKRKT